MQTTKHNEEGCRKICRQVSITKRDAENAIPAVIPSAEKIRIEKSRATARDFFTGNLLERKLSSEDSKQRFDVLLLLEEAFYQLLLCRRISPEK